MTAAKYEDIHVRTERKIDAQTQLIQVLTGKVNKLMADLDQVKADEDAEATAITELGSAVTTLIATINSLKAQLANVTLSAADQAKVDAIFAEAETNKAAAQAALTAATAGS